LFYFLFVQDLFAKSLILLSVKVIYIQTFLFKSCLTEMYLNMNNFCMRLKIKAFRK